MANKQWIKAPFKDIQPAVEKFVLQFTEKKHLKEKIDGLKILYEKARIEQLTATTWSKISNTDSWKTRNLTQMELLFKRNRNYGEVSVALKEIYEPKVRCPLILKMNGKLFLVEGETRLLVANVMKITPVRAIVIDTVI